MKETYYTTEELSDFYHMLCKVHDMDENKKVIDLLNEICDILAERRLQIEEGRI